jgi:hypothetical protein
LVTDQSYGTPLAVDASQGVAFASTTELAIAYYKTVGAEHPDGKLWIGGGYLAH